MCEVMKLLGSIDETTSGAGKLSAQVGLYSKSLRVAIAQPAEEPVDRGKIQALDQPLVAMELGGVLVQTEALHAKHAISSTSHSE